jgi:hypothetical protein
MRHLEQEEIQAKLELFPESFEHRFGAKLRPEMVKQILQEQLDLKEKQLIKEAFSDLSPNNIRYIISVLDNMDKPVKAKSRVKALESKGSND